MGMTSPSARGGDLIDATRPLEALRFLAGLGSGVEKLRVLARAPAGAQDRRGVGSGGL